MYLRCCVSSCGGASGHSAFHAGSCQGFYRPHALGCFIFSFFFFIPERAIRFGRVALEKRSRGGGHDCCCAVCCIRIIFGGNSCCGRHWMRTRTEHCYGWKWTTWAMADKRHKDVASTDMTLSESIKSIIKPYIWIVSTVQHSGWMIYKKQSLALKQI